jgi:hypothetical protein
MNAFDFSFKSRPTRIQLDERSDTYFRLRDEVLHKITDAYPDVKLDGVTKEWACAMLIGEFRDSKICKMVVNAILVHAGCSKTLARDVTEWIRNSILHKTNRYERMVIMDRWYTARDHRRKIGLSRNGIINFESW